MPNPGGVEIFSIRPDRPWGPPSLLYSGYRVFPGVKRPGRDVDHPPSSSAEVKERVDLYLCPIWAFVVCYRVTFTFTFTFTFVLNVACGLFYLPVTCFETAL
jgi:hypothetical protein